MATRTTPALCLLAAASGHAWGTAFTETREDCIEHHNDTYGIYTEHARIVPEDGDREEGDITAEELASYVVRIGRLRCAEVPGFFANRVPQWFRQRTQADNRRYRREGRSVRSQSWGKFAGKWFLADPEHVDALKIACERHGTTTLNVEAHWDKREGRCIVEAVVPVSPRRRFGGIGVELEP